jgi:hypothetical protein
MPNLRQSVTASCALLASLLAPLDAAPPVALQSIWRASEVTVDGEDGDWGDPAATLPVVPVAVSVMNDGGFLYLRVRALDRGAQMQLLFGGLTVWFDPKGGNKKVFGIRYPVGSPMPDPRSKARRPQTGEQTRPLPPPPGESPVDSARDRGPRMPLDPADIVPRRLEVLGPGKDDARSLVLTHAAGLTVGLGRVEGVLVYELQVPLGKSADTPYAIGASPGATIGLGFDSPKIERAKPPDDGSGSRRGGGGIGIGGMGMGGPGGMDRGGPGLGGQGPGQLPESAKPWKTWIKVDLARGGTSDRAAGRGGDHLARNAER